MKTIVPDYYPDFKCIASACRHTCCAGWEIDIDDRTLEKYNSVSGKLGERLRAGIRDGHFVLGGGERCPFLNEMNLCDIITEQGEEALCQVCRDHPRFRNFMSARTETGLGLTCEAAARLILSESGPVKLIALDDDGAEDSLTDAETQVLEIRDRMLLIAQDGTKSLDERLSLIAEEAGIDVPAYFLSEWADIYLELERLDENWTTVLESAKSTPREPVRDVRALTNLLVYLIYRHILPASEDGDIEGRTSFVLAAFLFLRNLGGDIYENARMWSGEIEYSDENISLLTDACFE